jgi:hypothetical protein
VRKVGVSKLARILPTGTLDYIFDDSGEKKFFAGPKQEFFVVGLRTIKLEKS